MSHPFTLRMRRDSRLGFGATVATLVFAGSIAAQCPILEQGKLPAGSSLSAGDQAGISVALSGSLAVVGAWADDQKGSNAGAAYVYRDGGAGFTEEAKLLPVDGVADDAFGYAVAAATSADVVAVSSRLHDSAASNAGAVYVYRKVGASWIQDAKLTASDAGSGDQFGWSVALDDDVLVVGAHRDNDVASDSGSAYVYRYDGAQWLFEQKLTASDASFLANFGWSVAVLGNTIVVGAVNADQTYVFERAAGVWTERQILTPINPSPPDRFGYSVAIDGPWIWVGAALENATYAYRDNGVSWVQTQKISASDGSSSDVFGQSVALDGGFAAVGARLDNDQGTDSGSAYLFRLEGAVWTERAKWTASDGAAMDELGTSVALSAGRGLVGAPLDDDVGGQSGGSYLFEAAYLGLNVDPTTAGIGDTVTIRSCGGVPGQASGLFLIEAAGSPAFLPLVLPLTFDASGQWSLAVPLAQSYGPIDLSLRVYSTGPGGGIVASNAATLTLL